MWLSQAVWDESRGRGGWGSPPSLLQRLEGPCTLHTSFLPSCWDVGNGHLSATLQGSVLPPRLRVMPGLRHLTQGLGVRRGIASPTSRLTCLVCVCWQLDKIEGVFERPSDEVIRELSRALRQALGVSLFGIDIIINNQTGQHAVIDINAFPGEPWSQQPPSSVCTLASLGSGAGGPVDQLPPSLLVGPGVNTVLRSLSPTCKMVFTVCGEAGKQGRASSQGERTLGTSWAHAEPLLSLPHLVPRDWQWPWPSLGCSVGLVDFRS